MDDLASQRDPVGEAERLRRLNLLNRRAVALLVEQTVYMVTVMPVLQVLLVQRGLVQASDAQGLFSAWVLILWAPLSLLRALLGRCSRGKRLLGLAVGPAGPPPGPLGLIAAPAPGAGPPIG